MKMKKIVSYLEKEKRMTHIEGYYTIKNARFIGGCYEFDIARNGGSYDHWLYAPCLHHLCTVIDDMGHCSGNYFPKHIKLARALWAKAFGPGADEYDNN